jgi:hypothetical protein
VAGQLVGFVSAESWAVLQARLVGCFSRLMWQISLFGVLLGLWNMDDQWLMWQISWLVC